MPVPLVAVVASHAAGLWWTYRLVQTRSVSQANKSVAKDWDILAKYGEDTIALGKALTGLSGIERAMQDFPAFARDVAGALRMKERLPQEAEDFLEQNFKLMSGLEREARLGYAQYAQMQANKMSGTDLARIERIYFSLYVAGRTNMLLTAETLNEARKRLLVLHKSRKSSVDQHLIDALTNLQSKSAPRLLKALEWYPLMKRGLKVKPEYIVHAFLPQAMGKLNHSGIAREIAERFGNTNGAK